MFQMQLPFLKRVSVLSLWLEGGERSAQVDGVPLSRTISWPRLPRSSKTAVYRGVLNRFCHLPNCDSCLFACFRSCCCLLIIHLNCLVGMKNFRVNQLRFSKLRRNFTTNEKRALRKYQNPWFLVAACPAGSSGDRGEKSAVYSA